MGLGPTTGWRTCAVGRIDAVLEAGEKRADFIRKAVERELRRREKLPQRASGRGSKKEK